MAQWKHGYRLVEGVDQKLEFEQVLNQGFAMDTRHFCDAFGDKFGKSKIGR